MKSCTFFGHRNIYEPIEDVLTQLLTKLIENDVLTFYVGSQGNFDNTVIRVLKTLKNKYPNICYYIVLAYIPTPKNSQSIDYYKDTLYPDGLEFIPKKYAISRRNEWMIEKSDYVIIYLKHLFSNTANLKVLSEKRGKYVINIADYFDVSIDFLVGRTDNPKINR